MASLGTISGQIRLDIRQAVAAYAALRAANAATIFALRGTSLAFLAAGSAATAGGVAIAAGFLYAIKAAAEFERRLDFFGAVSASTVSQMDAVREKALQLGRDTIYSANEIADSFIELGKAGVSAEMIIGGVGDAVANLGAAADIPLATAAQIMTAAVQTFELKASDAVHVTDLLAGAANASIVEVEDLGVSLKYVGGVANAISIPIEDVISALSLLGKAGIRGSTAGTSLRQIMVSLSGTSKKASGVLKELGIITADGTNKFFTAEGKAKSLADIFQILNDHTADLTEAQRLAAFKIIFNNRALAAASILAREGAAGFSEMNAEIGKTTAAEVAAKRLDNLSGDVEILKGNLQTLAIEAGTPFQEVSRQVVQFVTELVQAFSNLSPDTQKLIFQIIALVGAFLLVVGPIALLIGTIAGIAAQFLKFGFAIKFVLSIIGSVISGFAALLGLSVGPFLLIVAAIAAVAAGLIYAYKNSETFRNFLSNVGQMIVSAWGGFITFFQGLPARLSGIWSSITSGATTGWAAVGNFFTTTVPGFFSNMVDTVVGAVSGFAGRVLGFFNGLAGRAGTASSNFITTVITWFQQLPARVGAALSSLASTVGTALAAIPNLVAYWLGFALGFLIRMLVLWPAQAVLAMARFTAALITGFTNLAVAAPGYLMALGTRVFAILAGVTTTIVDFAQALPGRVATFFTQLVDRATTILNTLQTRAGAMMAAAIAWIVTQATTLPGRVTAFFAQTAARAVSLISSMASTVQARAASMVAAVISFFSQLPGRVGAFFTRMGAAAGAALGRMLAAARTFGSQIVSAITSRLAALPGLVNGLFNRAVSAITGLATRAFSAAASVASSLWNGFKAGLGINSPSYIEEAMFTINDTLRSETTLMARNIRAIQSVGDRFGADLQVPTQLATQAIAAEIAHQKRLVSEASRLGITSGGALPIIPGMTSGISAPAPIIVQAPAPEALLPDSLTLVVDGHQFTAYVQGVAGDMNDDMARTIYAGRR